MNIDFLTSSGCSVAPLSRRAPVRFGKLVAVAVLAAGLSGCAMFSTDPDVQAEIAETNDPFEGLNRHIFAVNLTLDTFILRPTAFMYREFVPEPGQDIVRNFINNLKLPFTVLNDLAQGETERAQTAFSRFLVNSTVGLGGLFDAARGLKDLDYHSEDAGQTLATYGIDEGPYLMLPLLGPSNARDAIGLAIEWLTDPVGIAIRGSGEDYLPYALNGADAVDTRARNFETIDNLQEGSLDFYATVRSLYRQRRASEIRNGEPGSLDLRPGIVEDAEPSTELRAAALPAASDQTLPSEGLTTAATLSTFEETARSYENAIRAFDQATRGLEGNNEGRR